MGFSDGALEARRATALVEVTGMPFPSRPDPSFEEDYDDGEPYSCMAAGAAGVPSRLDALVAKVDGCYGESAEKLEALVQADRKSTISALWEVWYKNRRLKSPPDHLKADWAAEQSALLGNTSIVESERD